MNPSLFRIMLYISLIICLIGLLYRIGRWFIIKTGSEDAEYSPGKRFFSALKGSIVLIFSPKILLFFKALIFDVIFQTRILKHNFLRWITHVFIFVGFMLLLLMHALDGIITVKLFADYSSTLNPFMFLRNLFGLMVIVGVALAIFRRARAQKGFLRNTLNDKFIMFIVAVIMLSGFLLEASKITSAPVFDRMIQDYSILKEPEEIKPLKVHWAKEFDVVFSDITKQDLANKTLLDEGKVSHEDNCAVCHTRPGAAFISHPVASVLKPLAGYSNEARADIWIYWVHVIACFIGLAWLPFSKFFHLISDPINIIANEMIDPQKINPANAATRRALELDACVNCGTCNSRCSVAPVYRMLGNEEILPAKKLATINAMTRGKEFSEADLKAISEGAFICTSCYKCTEFCPTAINLQDQWLVSKKELESKGHPLPHVWMKEKNAAEWADEIKDKISPRFSGPGHLNLTDRADTFSVCIQCQTCSNVCPVAACTSDKGVDVAPQKVMNLLRMGLKDIAANTRMAWDCTTCYQCQENCPQGIPVADIMYELKNLAYEHLRKKS
ncbi:MAG: 4Fe-4S dicluster domain-containing protein [bacterium]|nr:4Fe-4S dicluster domain-containing protein [bacterium]